VSVESQLSRRSSIGSWLQERLGLDGLQYPVPAHANALPYTLGGVTLTGFVLLSLTGIFLAQFYHPHPDDAHASVVYIITGAASLALASAVLGVWLIRRKDPSA